jgi:hypothetical protein
MSREIDPAVLERRLARIEAYISSLWLLACHRDQMSQKEIDRLETFIGNTMDEWYWYQESMDGKPE